MSDQPSSGARDTWATLTASGDLQFASDAYTDAAMEAMGWDDRYVAAGGADGTAAIRFLHRKRGPWTEALLPLFTPFTALRMSAPPDEHAVHARTSWLEALAADAEGSFDRVLLHLPPSVTDPRALQWRGWTITPRFTYRIPLGGPQDPVAAWSSAARRTLKKEAAEFECAVDPDALEDVVSLVASSYSRSGRSLPLPAERLLQFGRAVCGAGEGFVMSARRKGVVEAGVVVVHNASCGYYWLAGSVPGPAMTTLMASLLATLQQKGLREFDLVGANTPSIAEFKRRLGAERIPYFAAEFVRSRPLKLLLAVRRAIARGPAS